MIEYIFCYNLPATNSKWNCSDVFLTVRATLLPDDEIAIEFIMFPASALFEIIDKDLMLAEIKSLARTEFDLKMGVTETIKIIIAA